MDRMNDSRSPFDELEEELDKMLGKDRAKQIDTSFKQADEFGSNAWDSVLQDIDIPDLSRRGPEIISKELRSRFNQLPPEKIDATVQRLYANAAKAREFRDKGAIKDQREILRTVSEEDSELFNSLLANMQKNKKRGLISGIERSLASGQQRSIENIVRFMATEEDEPELDKLRKATAIQQSVTAQEPTGLLQEAAFGAAGMVPDLAVAMQTGGAGIAGLGAKASTAASLAYWTAQSSPEIRDGLVDAGVDKDLATRVGLIGGALVAGIELLQFKGLSKPFLAEAKQAVMPTMKAVAMNAAKEGGKELSKQWMEEMLQNGVTEGSKALARWMTDQGYSDEEKKQVLQSFYDTAEQSALALPLLLLPGAALQVATGNADVASRAKVAKENILSADGVMSFIQSAPDAAKIIAENEPTRSTFAQVFGQEDLRWTKQERQQFKEMVQTIRDSQMQEEAQMPAEEVPPAAEQLPPEQPKSQANFEEENKSAAERHLSIFDKFGYERPVRSKAAQEALDRGETPPKEDAWWNEPTSSEVEKWALVDWIAEQENSGKSTKDVSIMIRNRLRQMHGEKLDVESLGMAPEDIAKLALEYFPQDTIDRETGETHSASEWFSNMPEKAWPRTGTVMDFGDIIQGEQRPAGLKKKGVMTNDQESRQPVQSSEPQREEPGRTVPEQGTGKKKIARGRIFQTQEQVATEAQPAPEAPKAAKPPKKIGTKKKQPKVQDVPEHKGQIEFLPTERSSKWRLGKVSRYIGDGAYEIVTYPSKNLAKIERFIVDKSQIRTTGRIAAINQITAERKAAAEKKGVKPSEIQQASQEFDKTLANLPISQLDQAELAAMGKKDRGIKITNAKKELRAQAEKWLNLPTGTFDTEDGRHTHLQELKDFIDEHPEMVGIKEDEGRYVTDEPIENQDEETRQQTQPASTEDIPFITEKAIQKDKDAVDAMATLQSNIPVSVDDALQLEENPVSTQEIVTFMSKAFKIPIKAGRIAVRAALGVYERLPEIARVKGTMYGDISISAHEVAHHIDKKLRAAEQLATMSGVEKELRAMDYEPGRKNRTVAIREGFAEFMRYYVTMPAQLNKKAPKTLAAFESFMKQHETEWNNLQQLRQLVYNWVNQGAMKRVMAQMTDSKVWDQMPRNMEWKDETKKVLSQTSDWLYTRFKDAFHEYWKMGNKAAKKGYKGINPGALAQTLSMTGPTMALDAIQNGVISYATIRNADKSLDYRQTRIGPGLQEVLIQFPSQAEQNDLALYAYSRHAVDVHKAGMNPGISEADAQHVVNTLESKYGDKIKNGASALTQFNNNMSKLMLDTGVITKAEYKAMLNKWKNYVPLRRAAMGMWGRIKETVGGSTGMVNQGPAFKSLKGTGLPVMNPIYSTIQRAIEFYERANKQLVINTMVNIAQNVEGMNEMVRVKPNQKGLNVDVEEVLKQLGPVGEKMMEEGEKLDPAIGQAIATIYRPDYSPNMRDATVRVVVDGKPRLYELDKALYYAMTGMDALRLPRLFDLAFAMPTRLAKLGMTGISTSFAVSNPVADYVAFMMKTKEGGASAEQFYAPVQWIAKYAYENMNEIWTGKMDDPFIALYKQFGGEMNHMLGMDVDKIKQTLKVISGDTRKQRIMGVLFSDFPIIGKVPNIDTLRAALGVSEAGPRLAEFSMAMRHHGYDGARLREMLMKGEYPPMSVMTDAMLKAADVTTNFKRLGTWGRTINHMIPYFNARYESLDSMLRNYATNPKRAMIATAALAMMSALYWWANKDEDWYKTEAYWLKHGYWRYQDPVTGRIRRIKKPHEYGWFISSFVEGLLDKAYGENPEAVNKWFEYAVGQINPITPQNLPLAIKPAAEVWANKDTFKGDAPIVGRELERYTPEARYYRTTTYLARKLGMLTGIAPAQIDYMLNAYTGGIIGSVDKFTGSAKSGFKDINAADMPFIKAFAVRDIPSRDIEDMYDRGDQISQEINTQTKLAADELREKLGKSPEDEEVKALAESRTDDALRQEKRRIDAAKRQIQELRDKQRDMNNEDSFEIHKQIIGIARQALNREQLKSFVAPTNEKKTASSLKALARVRPMKKDAIKEWEREMDDAIDYLKSAGMTKEEAMKFYNANIARQTKDENTRFENRQRVIRRLNRLND